MNGSRRFGFRASASAGLGVLLLAVAAVAHAVVPGAWTSGNVQFANNCQIAAVLQPNAAKTMKRGAVGEVEACPGNVYVKMRYTELGNTYETNWESGPKNAFTVYAVHATAVRPGH